MRLFVIAGSLILLGFNRDTASAISEVEYLISKGTASAAVDAKWKREVKPDDFDQWKRIYSPLLSSNGNWVVYTILSARGEGELVVRSAEGSSEWRVPRGRIVDPQQTVTESVVTESSRNVSSLITNDSRFVVFSIGVPGESRGRENSHFPIGLPKAASLGLMSLPDGRLSKIANATSFVLGGEVHRHLAYTLINPSELVESENDRGIGTGVRRQRSARLSRPHTLMLHDLLGRSAERVAAEVIEYTFDDTGKYLAYAVSSKQPSKNGAYVRRLSDGKVSPLATGSGDYRGLTFDGSGQQIAFLSNRDEQHTSNPRYSLYYAQSMTSGAPVVKASTLEFDARISLSAGVSFSRSKDVLLFGIESDLVETKLLNQSTPGAVFDLWHWKDPRIQPQQKARANSNLYRPQWYRAIYQIATGRWLQLASDAVPVVLLGGDARYALGIDQGPYMIQETWGDFSTDLYRIDTNSGHTRLLRRGFRTGEWLPVSSVFSSPFIFSPGGRYLLYFENRRWFAFDFVRGISTDLTGHLLPEVNFDLEFSYAVNQPAAPIGIGGWTANDRRVLIPDRYDMWEIDPSGAKAPRNVTKSIGRKEHIVFRIWPNDHMFGLTARSAAADKPIVDHEPLLLTAHDRDTSATGLWEVNLGIDAEPRRLLMKDRRVTLLALSGTGIGTRYLFTQETFAEYPDLWIANDLGKPQKISYVNGHQEYYKWGNAELVNWTSSFGVPLQGVLLKPEDFDSRRKYPLIVNVYGRFSHTLHTYHIPETSPSAYISSPQTYLSKGYLIFLPDVVSATPYPGETSLASVISGVRSLIDRGFVDQGRMALVGHSWGGYEAAYITSHSDLFRCVIIGAATSNTISDYGSLESNGRARAYHYEHRSMLHGSSIWENPLVYLSNSPILFADRVRSPVLLLHNDNDGSVPFQQSVEFYLALRRNGKEVYLFNYKGEDHNLLNAANRLDWERRMGEFLDHFLAGQSKPPWMLDGIPHRGRLRIKTPVLGEAAQGIDAEGH